MGPGGASRRGLHSQAKSAVRSFLACCSRHFAGSKVHLSTHDSGKHHGLLAGGDLSAPDVRSLRDLRAQHDQHAARTLEEVTGSLEGLIHQLREHTEKMEKIVEAARWRRGG